MTSNEMDLPRKRNCSRLDCCLEEEEKDAVVVVVVFWDLFDKKGTIGLPFVPFC
jgi:hypothetical protein